MLNDHGMEKICHILAQIHCISICRRFLGCVNTYKYHPIKVTNIVSLLGNTTCRCQRKGSAVAVTAHTRSGVPASANESAHHNTAREFDLDGTVARRFCIVERGFGDRQDPQRHQHRESDALIALCYTRDQSGWQKSMLRKVDVLVDWLRV